MPSGSGDWSRLRSAFEGALAVPPEARRGYLESLGGVDAALRQRVERLLEAHERGGDFLEIAGELRGGPLSLGLAGQRIGPYQVQAQLGAGGMGEVYRAHDDRLHRTVALKFLLPDRGDSDRRARIHREARAAARLDHPFICKVYEVGDAGELTYIAMEYVAGQTMAARLAAGPVPLPSAVGLAIEMAEALAAAHDRGIVHRDLKPANIMIGDDGHTKVLDFGLASSALGGDIVSTAPGAVSTTGGTLAYMSPEQLRGEPADTRSDLFAAGIVLAELVTGTHPFAGKTAIEVASAILHDEPRVSLDPASPVSEPLRHVVRKALAKHPSERYASAHELLTDLRAVHSDSRRPWPHDRFSSSAPIPLTGRRVIAATVVALLLLLGTAVWIVRRSNATGADVEPQFLQVTSTGNVISAALSPDGQSVAYVAEEDGTRRLFVRDVSGGRALSLAESPWVDAVSWLPDGGRVQYRDRDGWLEVPRLGGDVRKAFPYRPASWSADGSRVAVASASRPVLMFFDASGQRLGEPMLIAGARSLLGVDWHRPTATVLVFGGNDAGGSTIWTTSDGQDVKAVHVDTMPILAARWRPGSSLIYFLRERAQTVDLLSVDAMRNGSTQVVVAGLAYSSDFSVSADGRRLLHLRAATRSNLALVDLARPNQLPQPLTRGTRILDYPAVSSDGRWIAAVSGGGAVTSIVKVARAGGEPVPLTDGQAFDHVPAWSPDGRQLAFGSKRNGENAVWLMDGDGRNLRKLDRANLADSLVVGWEPGGRIMWHERGNDALNFRLRNLATQQEELLVNQSSGFIFSPQFSPSGDAIAFRWGRLAGSPGPSGLYLLSWPQRTARLLVPRLLLPIGWAPDGESVYALASGRDDMRAGIYRVPVATGKPELHATVPAGTIMNGARIPGESSFVVSIRETSGDAWLIDLATQR